MNRLNLDFSLQSNEERINFLREYLAQEILIKKPLTEEELETCANYALWGKDPDGKNPVQKKEIQIKTRNRTWDKKEEESLDALLETPTFNESLIVRPSEARPKITKEIFSRKEALEKAPPHIKEVFIDLFKEIDKIDLILNYYDLAHGKRKNPPRPELLQTFSEEEQQKFKECAQKLNQYKYLKMRHLLIELRRQQFTLKDSYSNLIQRDIIRPIEPPPPFLTFDSDATVLPLGLYSDQEVPLKIFLSEENLIPNSFSESDLKKISKFYWDKQKEERTPFFFDFREVEHVYNLFLLFFELEDSSLEGPLDSTTKYLLRTLEYYIEMAQLSEVQQKILDLKMKKVKNQDIADMVNKEFGKSYTANYISTIFRQKIIKQINEAAVYHEQIVQNLFFSEEFKKCSACGRTLLKSPRNFVRKSRSKDGYANKCKCCDKKDRQNKKNQEENKNV